MWLESIDEVGPRGFLGSKSGKELKKERKKIFRPVRNRAVMWSVMTGCGKRAGLQYLRVTLHSAS